jgi:preflagellin peptidase FlaK
MVFNYIPLIAGIIAVAACLYASYTDFKRGIIPNKLTFPLIAVGLILNAVYAILMGNLLLIISAAIITGVIFALGYLFWKMGAWAGGDVKLFTALAALLAIYPPIINYNILNYQMPFYATYPFPFTLILNSILSMLPFLLIYVIYIGFKRKPQVLKELTEPIREYKKNLVSALVVSSAAYIAVFITFNLPFRNLIFSFILIIVLSVVISKLPKLVKAAVVSVSMILSLIQNLEVTTYGFIILFIIITATAIIRKLLTKANKEALQDDYKISELENGMISAYNLYHKGDEIYYDDKGFFDKIREAIKTGDLFLVTAPKGKLLVGTLAAGLEDKDIELLKKLSHEGKISDTFKVKKGVPFAPSILIGLLISLLVGDLVIILFNIVGWLLY